MATKSIAKATVRTVYQALLPLPLRERVWGFRHRQRWNEWQVPPLSPRYLIERQRSTRRLRQWLTQPSQHRETVVFLPSVLWDVPLFQRPQQMARAFAGLGYRVLYWEGASVAWPKFQIREVSPRIHVIRMPASCLKVIPKPLTISYTYNYDHAADLTEPEVVYEFIDHLDIFTNFPRPFLEANHTQLLERAQVVVGTADELLNTVRSERPDAILAPNGVDYEFFGGATANVATPDDIQPIVDEGKPIIGYYGALAEWFDYDLIHSLAQTMPDCNFVLIGPPYDDSAIDTNLSALPNVHLLGKRDYDALPGYLHAFSVATIPFKLSEAIQAVSPIKLYEYMAGGKPIVSSDMVECRKYPEVLIARSTEEWASQLRTAIALNDDTEYLTRVRLRGLQNTWQARAQQIIHALGNSRSPTSSADEAREWAPVGVNPSDA